MPCSCGVLPRPGGPGDTASEWHRLKRALFPRWARISGREMYPVNSMQVIVEKAEKSDIPDIDKKK